MWKAARTLSLVLSLFSACASAHEGTVIAKEQLVEMFKGMAKDTKWDLSKPMLWGYFFTDGSKAKLEHAAPLLQKQGYHFVSVYLSDKEHPKDPDLWWLHVEKVELHTPDTLDRRNKALEQFAKEQGLGSYDGMDVGPASARH
jgi:hypothetical protein